MRGEHHHPSRPGAALLAAVIIVSGALLALAVGLGFQEVREQALGEGEHAARQALVASESCVQEALLRIPRESFTGATLVVGGGTCTVSVAWEAGTVVTLRVVGMFRRWERRITVRADVAPPRPRILEWREWDR